MSVIANVAINVDSRNAVSKLREVQSQSQLTERAVQGLTSAFASLTAAFGAGFAISKVVQDVKELDTNLRRLGTVGGDVAALDKGLGRLSRNLDGVASKAELAAASYQALSAGFTETGANLRLVEAATKAAVGGLVDVTSVVEVTTKTLNAYGMSGSRAAEVTDSISKAIEFGQVQWSDYTSQLGRVASIAAIAGVSLDEVNAFIAAATKNGATAEIAFTGLGATLNTLLQPTKESQEAAAALGIQWNLAGLNAKGFDGLLAELAKKQDTNKEAAARLLGSQEAMRGVFAANAKAGKDFQMILEGLQGAAGKTESDFNQMKDTLENQLKALDTAFKNLSEALGVVFGPAAIDAIGGVTDAVNGFADIIKTIPEPVGRGALEIGKLVAQVILLQKAIQGIIALRLALIGMLTATATSAGTAATAASGLTMNMRYLQGSMVQANAAASPLLATLRTIAAFGVITVGINLIVTGLQEALTAAAEVRRLRGERATGGAAAIYGGSATADQKATARQTLAAVRKEQQRYRDPGTVAAQTLLGPLAPVFGVPTTAQAGRRRPVLQERARRAEAVLGLPTRAAAAVPTPTPAPTPTPTPDGADKRKGGGKSEAEKAAEKAARAAEQLKEQTEQQLKAAKDLQFTQANQLLQLRAKNDFERTFVEFGIKRSEIERKYNELLQQSKSTEETKLLQQARAAEYKQSSLILEQRALELTKQATQPLDDILKNLQDQAAYQREYGELIKNGTNPELAKQIIEINRAYEASVAALEPAIVAARAAVTRAEAEGASATEIEKYRKELERIQEIQGGLESKRGQAIGAAKEGAAKQPTVLDGIGERIKQLQADLNPIKLATDSIVSGADAIGQAFGQAFQDVATGAKSTQEALADAFKGIGQAFISMAAEIIAKQLTLILLQTIFNALSGGLGVGGSAPRGTPGAKAPNGLPYYGPAFADGGFVTGPTQALIGEGGEPEYVIPASKMRGAMARYAGGARGASVIPGNGESGGAGGGATGGVAPIDVRYTVERINSVDYVTADQFQAGMRQAAEQGARRGEQSTLRRLQQSTSTRRRLGM